MNQLVQSQTNSFINVALYGQINEQFTDQEVEMQNQYKDHSEELNSLHKGFIGKYLEFMEGGHSNQSSSSSSSSSQVQSDSAQNNKFYNNNGLLSDIEDDLFNLTQQNNNNNKQQNYQYNKLSHSNLLINHTNNDIILNQINDINQQPKTYLTFQTTMQRAESVFSAEEKLAIIQQYCLQIKNQVRDIEQKQRNFLLQFLQPILKNINEDPSKHSSKTLYALLNIAREDFLDIQLSSKVLAQIKKYVHENHDQFEIEQIKQVFYASCMKNRDTQFSIVEPQMFRSWFNKINQRIMNNECNERELILFMNYHHKDVELFRKTHKYISHVLLSNTVDGVLQRSKNAELLKVIVSIFCKHEKGSQHLYELFITSLYNLIKSNNITPTQLQVILRNLLRSQLFLSFRIITSFPYEIQDHHIKQNKIHHNTDKNNNNNNNLNVEQSQLQQNQEQSSLTESMDQMTNQENNKQINELENEENKQNTTNQRSNNQQIQSNTITNNNNNNNNSHEKSKYQFNVLDNYIKENMEQLSSNQILNILNLYQTINAQNYKETVQQLLTQLVNCFNSQCDNYFSFNITVRVLSLFQIDNPQFYLSLYKSTPQKLASTSNYYLQLGNTFGVLRQLLPSCWNSQYETVYQDILKNIINDTNKIEMQILRSSTFTLTPNKRAHMILIASILQRLNALYSTHTILKITNVDFHIHSILPINNTAFINNNNILNSKNNNNNNNHSQNNNNLQQNQTQQQQLSQMAQSFAIDILTPSDVMGNNIYNGNITMKNLLLKSFNIPHIILNEEFCNHLQNLNSNEQDILFVNEIRQQLNQSKNNNNNLNQQSQSESIESIKIEQINSQINIQQL